MKRKAVLVVGLFVLTACSIDKTETGVPSSSRVDKADDVKSVSRSKRMVAVHADYCSVCSEMKPLVKKIKSRCEAKGILVEAVDLNEENEESVIEKFKVAALPTYIFLDGKNEEVARLVGAQSEEALAQALSVLSGEDCQGVGRIVSYEEKREAEEKSCRFTNTDAKIAAKNSKLSGTQVTEKKSDAPSVIESQRSCSPASL